ncbi:hypothetical protein ACLOJK_037032 [Asimina triloba]
MYMSSSSRKRQFSPFSSSPTATASTATTILKSGFTPTSKPLNRLLLSLSRARRFALVCHVFYQMSANNLRGDRLTYSIVSQAEKALLKHPTHSKQQKDPERAALSFLRLRSLILTFTSHGKMDRALAVLEMMPDAPLDDFVCSSMISGFCKIGKPEIALAFYNNAVENGFSQPGLVTYTALASALCQQGRIDELPNLVCEMEKKGVALDAVFYSTWISHCFQEGDVVEALQRHRLMAESGVTADTVNYTNLVDGFSKEGIVEKAVGFLNTMNKSGLRPNLVTYTSIMRGLCQKGRLEEAFGVLQKVEEMGIGANEVAYAVLIDGFCKVGNLDQAFCLFKEMESKGIVQGIVTCNVLIDGLCKAGRTDEANKISWGILGDNFTYSSLMHSYIKEGNMPGVLETMRRLEESGILVDVATCNVLIRAFFELGKYEDAFRLYKGMAEMGLVANSITSYSMIDGLCRLGRMNEALEIFFHSDWEAPSVRNIMSYNCVIRGLCRKGMVDLATDVFHKLYKRGLYPCATTCMDLIKAKFERTGGGSVLELIEELEVLDMYTYGFVCNKVISFLCTKGSVDDASKLCISMRREGLVVRSECYSSMFKGLLRKGNELLFQLMLSLYIKEYNISDSMGTKILFPYLCQKDVNKALHFFVDERKKEVISIGMLTDAIDALIRKGRVNDAHKLFKEAEGNGMTLDVVVYSIMVNGMCKEGRIEEALYLCMRMRKKGILPNIVIYNSVIYALCRQGCLVAAFRLFDSLDKHGILPTNATYTTLIGALATEGFLEDATKLFKRMVVKGLSPTTHLYNFLIAGYCQFGSMDEALKLLSSMERSCQHPDPFTVSALINRCCQTADLEAALGFFGEFRRKGLLPDYLGFLNLIKGLCTKGRMEEARSILIEMLQNELMVEMINKVGDCVKIESLVSFLNLLCEQGSIQEATGVLGEVGSLIFPRKTRADSRVTTNLGKIEDGDLVLNHGLLDSAASGIGCELGEKLAFRKDSYFSLEHDMGYLNVNTSDKHQNHSSTNSYDLRETFPLCNFDVYYSIITSLCSKGELKKANSTARKMLLDFEEHC